MLSLHPQLELAAVLLATPDLNAVHATDRLLHVSRPVRD